MNAKRPYCEGHERTDVVSVREDICKYLTKYKSLYYTQTEGDSIEWVTPIRQEIDGVEYRRRILLCHDESTLRTGETTKYKWMIHGEEPLFNKGRGRSFMESDVIVLHSSGPFLELSHSEFEKACIRYPELKEDPLLLNYTKNGDSSFIALNSTNYFDNDTILVQFESFFNYYNSKKLSKNMILKF